MSTAVTLSPPTILQFFDNNGRPNAGGSILTQVGGVNYATYQDSAGNTPLPNPIPLNNRGEISNASGTSCQLFLATGVTYTFTMYDANGNVLNSATGVGTSTLAADLASTATNKGASLVAYLSGANVFQTLQRTIWLGPEYGAALDGSGDCTAAVGLACTAAGPFGIVMAIDGATYGFTQPLSITASSGACAQLMCRSWATFSFSGVSSSYDLVTVSGGASQVPILFTGINVQGGASRAGRDGLVINRTTAQALVDVQIGFTQRDGLVLSVAGSDEIENLRVRALIQDIGRYPIRRELTGSGGAFINEIIWEHVQIRRWSQVTAGACAVYSHSDATGVASKISGNTWLKSNGDLGYTAGTGVMVPDTAIWVADGNAAIESETFSGAQQWENTGATDMSNGYTWDVRGTATWVGLICPSVLNQSKLGIKYANPAITRKQYYGFGSDIAVIDGTLFLETNPCAGGHVPTQVLNATGDGTPAVISTLTVDFDRSGALNASNGQFTAVYAGLYRFTARVPLSGISGHTSVTLQANIRSGSLILAMGDAQNATNTAVAGAMSIGGDRLLNLAAGDYVQAQVIVSGGAKVIAISAGVDAYVQFERIG